MFVTNERNYVKTIKNYIYVRRLYYSKINNHSIRHYRFRVVQSRFSNTSKVFNHFNSIVRQLETICPKQFFVARSAGCSMTKGR